MASHLLVVGIVGGARLRSVESRVVRLAVAGTHRSLPPGLSVGYPHARSRRIMERTLLRDPTMVLCRQHRPVYATHR